MKELTLNQLTPGQTMRVTRLTCGKVLRRSLLAHGLTGGTSVRCLHRNPRGAAALYEVRGSLLAIRKSDAVGIIGERLP
ncbi:MAG: ferrous iron transport protein A [Oscillospiraceae bacterium]|nr:ferrous iron transport protein A [Oscillospiraceae bacterium]